MVPIRFVSEAMGAQVGWTEALQLVSITSAFGQSTAVPMPTQRLRRVLARSNEVIPMTLDNELNSMTSSKGDPFTATVRTGDSMDYAGIPAGTKIEGHIAAVHAKDGNNPGILDLAFDRLRFTDGRSAAVSGTLTSLDDKHVTQDANGVMTAKTDGGADKRMVYAGYGAGAGLLVGVLTKRPLETTILGGALGYIIGQVQRDQRKASNVKLVAGTELGLRLDKEAVANW
jgi:hypothetical protein